MTPVINCTIISYNRRDWLLRAIDALISSTLREPFELCVVLDGCTDGSAAAVTSRFRSLPAHISPVLLDLRENVGIGAARQAAVERAAAPLIAFIDDECVPDPDFLSLLVKGFMKYPSAIGYGGFVRGYSRDTLNRRFLDARDPHRPLEADLIGANFFTRLRIAVHPPRRNGVRRVYSLVGPAMAFRYDALVAVGGFDRGIRFGGEETQVCEALRARFGDACLLADPETVIAHEFHPDISGTFRRALRAGAAHGRDFVRRGGIPTIPPNPAFVAAAVLGGLYLTPVAAVALGMSAIAFLYGRVARGRFPEALLYPLLLCLEDGAKDVGFLLGVWRHRREWRREIAA